MVDPSGLGHRMKMKCIECDFEKKDAVTAGKDSALIYTIYLSHTHDLGTLKMVRQATNIEHENKVAQESSTVI
jgi:hypothetical protein